jgi:hypothetical protein
VSVHSFKKRVRAGVSYVMDLENTSIAQYLAFLPLSSFVRGSRDAQSPELLKFLVYRVILFRGIIDLGVFEMYASFVFRRDYTWIDRNILSI